MLPEGEKNILRCRFYKGIFKLKLVLFVAFSFPPPQNIFYKMFFLQCSLPFPQHFPFKQIMEIKGNYIYIHLYIYIYIYLYIFPPPANTCLIL